MKTYDVIRSTRRSSLTPAQRLLLICISYRAGEDGDCWASAPTLAEDTGLSERHVRRELAALVQCGALTADMRPGRTTVYRVSGQIPTPDTVSGVKTPGHPVTPDTTSGHPGHGVTPDAVSPLTPRQATPDMVSPPPLTPCPGTPDTMSDDQIPDPIQGSDPRSGPRETRARATPPAPLSQGLTSEQIAARERLLRQQEADTGKPASRRDSLTLTHLLSTGVLPERLDWLWEWSGVSEDPSVAGCRAGGWRVWSSLVKGERGEERLRAAADWVSAGRPTGSDGPPGRSAARGQSTSGDGALARVAKRFAASNTVIEEVTLGEG